MENSEHRFERWEKKAKNRKGEYIGAIVMNLVWIYVATHLTRWGVECLKDNFGAVLWAIVLNAWIQIGGNALMFLFDMKVVRRLTRIVLEVASFFTILMLYTFFPFDFSVYPGWHFLNWVLPIFFIIGMVVSVLKVIGNLWKLIFWRN